MASSSGAGAAMAASANGKLRPQYGRRGDHMLGRRINLAAYVAGGGSTADYARIHKMPLAAVRRMLAEGPR